MDELDQDAISKILGSKMKPVKRAKFGNFGSLEIAGEIQQELDEEEPDKKNQDRDG